MEQTISNQQAIRPIRQIPRIPQTCGGATKNKFTLGPGIYSLTFNSVFSWSAMLFLELLSASVEILRSLVAASLATLWLVWRVKQICRGIGREEVLLLHRSEQRWLEIIADSESVGMLFFTRIPPGWGAGSAVCVTWGMLRRFYSKIMYVTSSCYQVSRWRNSLEYRSTICSTDTRGLLCSCFVRDARQRTQWGSGRPTFVTCHI